jgi:putative transposase
MILTYKVRHHQDFTAQLRQAKQVAKFAISNRDKLSSKHVAHFGLKSAISNQILREYGRNKKCKAIRRVKLIVPSQAINFLAGVVEVVCLDLKFPFDKTCEKINQIEVDNEWLYVSVTVSEEQQLKIDGWVGIDRNTTGHCAVAACTKTDKVMFLGKQAQHVHKKYSRIRKKLQRLGKLKKLKTIKRRESNITKDLNHKISRKVVNYARANNCGIKLEKLEGIRQRTKQAASFRYSLNSWAYYQLQQFVEYKAQIAGVPVAYIEPAYTSQRCHKCGQLGNRNGKSFKCSQPDGCGYTSHADGNASWNIAYSEKFLGEPKAEHCCTSASSVESEVYTQRLLKEGDFSNGTTDSPQLALA